MLIKQHLNSHKTPQLFPTNKKMAETHSTTKNFVFYLIKKNWRAICRVTFPSNLKWIAFNLSHLFVRVVEWRRELVPSSPTTDSPFYFVEFLLEPLTRFYVLSTSAAVKIKINSAESNSKISLEFFWGRNCVYLIYNLRFWSLP